MLCQRVFCGQALWQASIRSRCFAFSSKVPQSLEQLQRIFASNSRRAAKTRDNSKTTETAPKPPKIAAMPIDEHRERILRQIRDNQITVLCGETGCGKSTRVPVFLAQDTNANSQVRVFLSQPRRLAARSLAARLRESLGEDGVGLRLGNGVTERINPSNTVVCGTAGYLSRVLSFHPSSVKQYTHIIIDEVHERSLDADMLCMLGRDLTKAYPSLRLIVMSATVNSEQYCRYFNVDPSLVLHVGAKRFPVEVRFLEDITLARVLRTSVFRSTYDDLMDQCKRLSRSLYQQVREIEASGGSRHDSRHMLPLSKKFMASQLALVPPLIESISHESQGGEAVLIFVSGIQEIEQLTYGIRRLRISNDIRPLVIPVHGSLPSETQMLAMTPAEPGVLKIVVATNAAESSLTIPDANHVVDLGGHKMIQLDQTSTSRRLVSSVIPVSSAVQRLGRTGRVRPGTAYRLYTKEVLELLPGHETPEVQRTPLQGIVLDLRASNDQPVTPTLSRLMDPPDAEALRNVFQALHEKSILTTPYDEDSQLTVSGRFVASLGTVCNDTALFLRDAYLLGVLPDAISIAARYAAPKSPEMEPSPMMMSNPRDYNTSCRQAVRSRFLLDGGLYSDHMAWVNTYALWLDARTPGRRVEFCRDNALIAGRMDAIDRVVKSLFNQFRISLETAVPDRANTLPKFLKHETLYDRPQHVMTLRLLLNWSYAGQMIESFTRSDGINSASIRIDRSWQPKLTPPDIEYVLQDLPGITWSLDTKKKVKETRSGRFIRNVGRDILQQRLKEFMPTKKIAVCFVRFGKSRFVVCQKKEMTQKLEHIDMMGPKGFVELSSLSTDDNERIYSSARVAGGDYNETISKLSTLQVPYLVLWETKENEVASYTDVAAFDLPDLVANDIDILLVPMKENDLNDMPVEQYEFTSSDDEHSRMIDQVVATVTKERLPPKVVDRSLLPPGMVEQPLKIEPAKPTIEFYSLAHTKPFNELVDTVCRYVKHADDFDIDYFVFCPAPLPKNGKKKKKKKHRLAEGPTTLRILVRKGNIDFIDSLHTMLRQVEYMTFAYETEWTDVSINWKICEISVEQLACRKFMLVIPKQHNAHGAKRTHKVVLMEGLHCSEYIAVMNGAIVPEELQLQCSRSEQTEWVLSKCSHHPELTKVSKRVRNEQRLENLARKKARVPRPVMVIRRNDIVNDTSTVALRVLNAISKGHFNSQHIQLVPAGAMEALDYRVDLPNTAKWSMVAESNDKAIRVQPTRFSFLDTMLLGNPLMQQYGVCANVLVLGAMAENVRVEGVTLFPAGHEWIDLALRTGAPTEYLERVDGTGPRKENDRTGNIMRERAAVLRKKLTASRESLSPDYELQESLMNLFADWIGEPTPLDLRANNDFEVKAFKRDKISHTKKRSLSSNNHHKHKQKNERRRALEMAAKKQGLKVRSRINDSFNDDDDDHEQLQETRAD